jgi:hypothetical protein
MPIFFSFILFLQSLPHVFSEGEFTCQGDTYAKALLNCPDFGSQRFSSGGNVSVLVKSVKNLPDRDVMGSSSTSDP